jgi:hypothetical protein
MKTKRTKSPSLAVMPQQFGVSQAQIEALCERYQAATVEFGAESPDTIMALARLCVGYGMKEQAVASAPVLLAAVQLFAEREEAHACPHANREGALAMSVLAFRLIGDIQADTAVQFANVAYGILANERTAHPVDVARVAHVGALSWSCKGSLKQAKAALTSAKQHLRYVSRKVHPEIFNEHDWLEHVITTHTEPTPGTLSR